MNQPPKSPAKPTQAPKDARKAKLAEALRKNLLRRKAADGKRD